VVGPYAESSRALILARIDMTQKFKSAEFYSRQTVLPELGPNGQQKLRASVVTVIGLGGLGSVSTIFLSLAGVGSLKLVDQDTVEMKNLHRQPLYSLTDLRHPKVDVATRRLSELNPETKVEPIAENLESRNIASIISDTDCVVDGLDNMETRYLINRYCVEKRIPYVFGGAIGMEGNVAVFKSPETACLECVMPGLKDADLPTCETRGILGATAGIVGAIQALEAIKVLTGIEPESTGKLMLFDFAQSEFRTIDLRIRLDCEVCQKKTATLASFPRRIAWLCGSNTANVNPEEPVSLDLTSLSKDLARDHTVLLATSSVVVFDYRGHEVSLFRKGRMLIKNVRDEEEALEVFRAVERLICAG